MKLSKKPRPTARSRFDLGFRPPSYWRVGRRERRSGEDEIELARITFGTPTRDAVALKARRVDRRIVYRFVHQDVEGPSRHRIRTQRAASARPLTFGEVVELLERACFAGRCGCNQP